ncbi:hypothetical protein ETD86_10795 [Nonomuraea turkmeniaca]|uniref:Alpha-amylase n=1 Tax=Nonomuraea turkmeniaca TaxID=103838 RepID=A0A5S4FPK1_9ACTN|nr:hypothetical protein [Nonomuraea turkmeniaca]TMR22616.1 hypothetical protein ETD86_10795 [Nonomuraea turkmeniaca]
MRKSVTRAAMIVAFSGAALVGVVSPASAGAKPGCVSVDVHNFNNVTMHNNCSTSHRLKVVWRYARDSGCFTVNAGASRDVTAFNQPFAEYDKVETC